MLYSFSSTFYKADTTLKNGHLKMAPAFLYSFSVTSSKDLFTWRWGAQVGEVTRGGSPHLSCKRDQN